MSIHPQDLKQIYKGMLTFPICWKYWNVKTSLGEAISATCSEVVFLVESVLVDQIVQRLWLLSHVDRDTSKEILSSLSFKLFHL